MALIALTARNEGEGNWIVTHGPGGQELATGTKEQVFAIVSGEDAEGYAEAVAKIENSEAPAKPKAQPKRKGDA